ncbi:WAS/WASL-interacting protein family member 1-like [Lontra canadensis]|uniref:WAS/WASL-interacting protein family member 1-like n=1 Tax=Lontra canadensis TaxID=76717 RepID=UPI0013F38252|nr:WAS/WASL-interacting protein family member 1-like [Lontra canadensis]
MGEGATSTPLPRSPTHGGDARVLTLHELRHGRAGTSSRTESPPAPSRIRCSTPSRAAKSPPPASQGSCTPGPRPPGDALTFPHHRLQPRGRHLPPGAPPLPGLSQGGGVAPRVSHLDPAPRSWPLPHRSSERKICPPQSGRADVSTQTSEESLEGSPDDTRRQRSRGLDSM